MGIFSAKIAELRGSGRIFSEPEEFISYLARTKQETAVKTQAAISVDFEHKLDAELRANNYMVLRLGAYSGGSKAFFTVIDRAKLRGDMFIDECMLVPDDKYKMFVPLCDYRTVFSFKLLPNFTETSLVNFCIATGAVQTALGIDTKQRIIPATGQGIYRACPKRRDFASGSIGGRQIFASRSMWPEIHPTSIVHTSPTPTFAESSYRFRDLQIHYPIADHT